MEFTEQLCVLAVQAHAERNTWQEVLPFVQKVYGDIEHSPAAIVQLWWVEQAVCYMYGGIPVYIKLILVSDIRYRRLSNCIVYK